MTTLKSKTHVISELKKAGIQICLSRTTTHNSFNLVYESYGFFAVNAIEGTSFELVQNFNKIYGNIKYYLYWKLIIITSQSSPPTALFFTTKNKHHDTRRKK
jgi:hypothetical protein